MTPQHPRLKHGSAMDAASASGSDAIPEQTRAWLSALVDGEVSAVQPGCTSWRDDPQARQTWHAYHLIGDVMRSEELASLPTADRAFLQRLRARLADEPVVLAPTATPVRGRLPWLLPAAAVVAGFVAVGSALIVLRPQPDPGAVLAQAQAPAPRGAAVASAPSALIRDSRLDDYLRAHQAARGAAALPGGGLRSAELVMPMVMPAER